MLEYASIRFRLLCATPDHRPQDHRRRREDPDDRRPVGAERLERRQEHAREGGERGRLDAGGHEAGHDGRRALVGIRRPHVERHRGDLEGEADQQQADRDEDERVVAHRLRGQVGADAIEARAAAQPVGEGDAVEEERARERAEQEVLERRLGRPRIVAPDAGQHVDGDRQDLERDEDHQQIVGGRHHDHAGDREQDERVVLALRQAVAAGSPATRT